MTTSIILVNHRENEPFSRDQLGHHLAFTKSGQEPNMLASFGLSAPKGEHKEVYPRALSRDLSG